MLFLFNGGEESLMQAAHGFVHSGHRWVNDIGVFINLEATGSGGPDTLFQHTAGWTAQTYAAAARYPRGSVFLQVGLLLLLKLTCKQNLHVSSFIMDSCPTASGGIRHSEPALLRLLFDTLEALFDIAHNTAHITQIYPFQGTAWQFCITALRHQTLICFRHLT